MRRGEIKLQIQFPKLMPSENVSGHSTLRSWHSSCPGACCAMLVFPAAGTGKWVAGGCAGLTGLTSLTARAASDKTSRGPDRPCVRGPGRWSTLTHLTRYPHTQVGTTWQRVCHCVRNSRLQLIKSSSLVSNRLELAGWASRFASSPSSLSVCVCVCVCVCVSLSVAWWSKSPVAYATY